MTGALKVLPPSVDLATPTSSVNLPGARQNARVEKDIAPVRSLVSQGSPKLTQPALFGMTPPSVNDLPPSREEANPLRLVACVKKGSVFCESLKPTAMSDPTTAIEVSLWVV